MSDIHKSHKIESNSELQSQYRDRAAERRRFQENYTENDYNFTLSHNNNSNNSNEPIKGLDYNLLNEIRNSQSRHINTNKNIGLEAGSSELGGLISRSFFSSHPHHIKYEDQLNNLYLLICKGFTFNPTSKDIFTRNKIYVFDHNNITNHTCGDPWTQGINPYPEDGILKELNNAILWHQENRKKPIHERESARVLDTHSNDDDDDIFTNASKYTSDNIQVDSMAGIGTLDNIYEFENEEYEIHTYKPKIINNKRQVIDDDVYLECFPDFHEIDIDNEDNGKKKGKKTGIRKEWGEIKSIIEDKRTIGLDELDKYTKK